VKGTSLSLALRDAMFGYRFAIITVLFVAGCSAGKPTSISSDPITAIGQFGGKVEDTSNASTSYQVETTVDFSNTQLTDEDLSRLVPSLIALRHLRVLDVTNTRVTVSGLYVLTTVPQLMTLRVSAQLFDSPEMDDLSRAKQWSIQCGNRFTPIGGRKKLEDGMLLNNTTAAHRSEPTRERFRGWYSERRDLSLPPG
jgi:hypothetical protein